MENTSEKRVLLVDGDGGVCRSWGNLMSYLKTLSLVFKKCTCSKDLVMGRCSKKRPIENMV